MTIKRFTLFGLISALLLVSLSAIISAQDDDSSKRKRGRLGFDHAKTIILEATGLEGDALLEALKAGSTLAELIEANGGDVDSVIADLTAQAAAAINANVAQRLESLEAAITERVNSSSMGSADGKGRRGRPGRPMPRGGFGLWGMGDASIVLDATGLDVAGLLEALKAGSTLAELIEANGGDVDSVIADLVAQATAAINANVAQRLESLEAAITERVNSSSMGSADGKGRRGRRGFGFWGMGDASIVLDATGLDVAGLLEALKAGSTLAELIEANGGDVDSVIADLTAQAAAAINANVAQRLESLEAEITERVNGSSMGFADGKGRRGRRGFGFWGMKGMDSAEAET